MYNRKAIEYLIKWSKKKERKPLILRGARQVGKTTLVNNFSENFKQYIYLNLEETEDKQIFEQNYSFENLLSAIFFIKQKEKKIKNTLIFIDEIQNSAEAVKQLRYFYEKAPDIYVIAAGSLLETLMSKNISFPVGRVEYLFLQAFSFEEYLWAINNKNLVELWNKIPLPEYAHNKLLSTFNTYSLIGGMPDIIKNYIENNDIVSLNSLYESLIVSYLDDVEKYAQSNKEAKIIRFVIKNAFSEAGNRIKFNGFAKSNYKSREIGETMAILEKTHLLKLIYPTTNTQLPIVSDTKKSPKLQILDTGLVNYFAGLQQEIFNSNDIQKVYKGRIAEHIVSQELKYAFPSILQDLHFWVREKKQSNAEVDFVIPFDGKLIPIEVKSGATGRLRSLHQFIDLAPHNLSVRIYAGKIRIEKTKTITGKQFYLLNLPYYLTSKIKEYLKYFVEKIEQTT
ncbi:MAG: AAA family ATPase [Bacteroidetes bacterium]|nr:MAG: AAA family ATPase [Bacteroidota bacterium]